MNEGRDSEAENRQNSATERFCRRGKDSGPCDPEVLGSVSSKDLGAS